MPPSELCIDGCSDFELRTQNQSDGLTLSQTATVEVGDLLKEVHSFADCESYDATVQVFYRYTRMQYAYLSHSQDTSDQYW